VRVLLDGVELGSDVVGGFLYEDARDVLTDGVAEDMIWTAMSEAEKRVVKLADTFGLKAMQLSVDKQVH
jgi:phosphoribosylformimino-5-aminoimidazole carboxamide ribonucleotide (ProFAR) isomerase